MAKPKPQPSSEKPKKNYLLIEFSFLSMVAFLVIGYVVVSAVRPAIENFTIEQEEASTVVFVNRYAGQILTAKDFEYPLTSEQKERMVLFVNTLSIRGSLRIFVTDAAGTVIYAQPEEGQGVVGSSLADNPDVAAALEPRRATARFKTVSSQEQEILGVKEVFVQIVPITFGTSYEVSGVVYSISRVGLLETQINAAEENMVVRIVGGLSFLYALLFIIVWRASRTIRSQSNTLESYARTLEQRVVERTKKLEESTERQIAQAKELARLKDEFVFIAAHELKAPITHLRWTLAEYFSSADAQEKAGPSVRNVMQVIQKASDSLTNLVTDLLSVARLESGTIKISVHPTDLVSVIQDAVLQFKGEAEKNKMRLELRYDTSKKSPFVLGDSERLKEVFSNLIANAIKFTPEGGRVDVTVTHMGNVLEAQVKDTGIGMDKEELSKLFTKFWRANVNIEGTGLGLWLSKELVTRMGGEISVESTKGIGSTFTVRLPVAKENGVRSEGRKA